MTVSSVSTQARSLGLTILLLSVFAFAAVPAQAQMSMKPGVRAGVNMATFGGDDADAFTQAFAGLGGDASSSRRTGFAVGGFVLLDLTGPIDIQPELLYVQKGQKSDFDATILGQQVSGTSTVKLDYIEVPVLARINIPAAGFSPYILAGPSISINVGANIETEISGGGQSQSDSQDISEDISGTAYGGELGAGVGFGLGAGTLSIDARYGLGFSNVPDTDQDVSIKNRGIMLSAGFTF